MSSQPWRVSRLVTMNRFQVILLILLLCTLGTASEKETSLQKGRENASSLKSTRFQYPQPPQHKADRKTIYQESSSIPIILVQGTPYQMGYQLGQQIGEQMHRFIPTAMAGITRELHMSLEELHRVWLRTAAYTDDRLEQELIGLADGAKMSLSLLQAMHAVPLLMPYSCSSIAVWGKATEDGHLYQTRNLDWSLEVGAHEFPVIVVYQPKDGIAHVLPTFAGMIGAHTGMNAKGIALSEMGDAPAREMPYQIHAPHFTTFFRTLLYDADSLSRALSIFKQHPLTKRYHYVFGDGQTEQRAVKIRAHSPEALLQQVTIWHDNDPTDEFAPNVLPCIVYNDEGRGAFPTLKKKYGQWNGEALVDLANQIPIKGGNVVNVIYDATALTLWISYAKGEQEAYQRPYAFLDLKKCLANPDHSQ